MRRFGVATMAVFLFVLSALRSSPASAAVPVPGNECSFPVVNGITYHFEDTILPVPLPADICSSAGYRCEMPVHTSTSYQFLDPTCDPVANECQYQARVEFELPGNQENLDESSPLHVVDAAWYEAAMAPTCYGFACGQKSICGQAFTGRPLIDGDSVVFTATVSNRCRDIPAEARVLSLAVRVCPTNSSCRKLSAANEIKLGGLDVAAKLGCPPPPPPERCGENASCESCPGGIGIGGSGPPAGGPGGPPGGPRSGDGAYLNYTAGGGSAASNATLGRYWSHDYAQYILEDPLDPSDPPESRVHLVTEYGTYRTFSGLVGGVYTEVSPSDEYRTLAWNGAGWTLTDLQGSVTEFTADGAFLSHADRNDNMKTAVYDAGRLSEVHFADQTKELFGYYESPDPAEGKLEAITVVGIDGVTTREWRYEWGGDGNDDLVRIERPDGTAVEYSYENLDHPGYLTRIELVGTGRRIERAWQYDTEGRVAQAWSGDASPTGPDAVDRWQYSYDSETQTTVTDPLGREIVYTYDRDPASTKVRVRKIEGDCPSCGLGPNAQIDYDPVHHLRPMLIIDGIGNQTRFIYDGNGQVLTRTEAVDVAGVERTTTYEYDPTYGALVTEVSMPSVEPGQLRHTLYGRDGNGNVTSQEPRGWEAGQPFDCTVGGAPCYETTTTFNAAGQPLAVDPPGYGTDDVTSYTYDSARGSLVAETRTDPLIGTTAFGHDAYNRRTSTTDPSGVATETEYDELDRVTKVIQKGSIPTEDLVTEHVYSAFGDLQRTILPAGNVIEYGYDDAGRLASIERKPDAATPAERTVYTLDDAGNRTREDLQRWTGSQWVTEATTSYLYTTRCQLDQILNPDGSITEHAYDCNGNLERTWDANHPSAGQTLPPTAEYAYDELDRLVTVTRPWAGAGGGVSITTYDYDVQDHLVSIKDAEGNETTYKYSDRDLLTEETSPVSGLTTHVYNHHGELIETTDARGKTELRSVDELDRVTFLNYTDDTLDTAYIYDDPLVPFSLGRLTAITRDGHTIAYAYDRFGRTTQDGDLTYGYDANSNRTTIGYPGGVTATYGHDVADRETTLTVTTPEGTTSVVTMAKYLPSGPLTELTFGTGAVETHAYDTRYLPAAIALDAAADRTWVYTNDDIGNVTEIMEMADCPGDLVLTNHTVMDGEEIFESCAQLEAGPAFTVEAGGEATLRAASRVVLHDGFAVLAGGRLVVEIDPTLTGNVARTYGYQDIDYFLTSATGSWGSQSWTYDKIGNRLSETDDGATDSYDYTKNGTGGNTARLTSIDLAGLGSRDYEYTFAGHVEAVTAGSNVVDFGWDDAGRLKQSTSPNGTSPFRYDGRGFLRTAGDAATAGTVTPTYDSAGLLHALLREPAGGPTRRYHVFYLAGRPVAQVATETGQPDRWWYLTTDHLGTPLIAIDAAGAELWENRFEPFGTDPWAGTAAGALANEINLRFPGQWEDEVWQEAMLGAGGSYNVFRWYTPATGRYSRPDPMGIVAGDMNPYLYALSNPIIYIDEFGLATFMNFPPGKKEEAERALQEALQKLKDQPCCTGSKELTEELQAKLSDPDLVIVYKPRLKACGKTPFLANVFGRLRLQLGPLAFDPVRCCDLSSTMVHEASHIGFGGSESDAQQIERDCFNCPSGR